MRKFGIFSTVHYNLIYKRAHTYNPRIQEIEIGGCHESKVKWSFIVNSKPS